MNVQQSDPAPQQQAPTRVADRATDHTIRFETWVGYNSTSKYFKVRTSCHVPCCSTPTLLCSRTHRTVPVQMWMDETKSSFEMAKAKIDGREITYPYLLDAKRMAEAAQTSAGSPAVKLHSCWELLEAMVRELQKLRPRRGARRDGGRLVVGGGRGARPAADARRHQPQRLVSWLAEMA